MEVNGDRGILCRNKTIPVWNDMKACFILFYFVVTYVTE